MNDALHLSLAVNWDDIDEEIIRPGVRRKIYSTPDVMLCWHHLSRDMALRPHSHDDFDQLALVLEGEADYFVDGTPHRMRAGSMLFVPATRPHYIEPVTEHCINVDVFAPPRKDYAGSGFRVDK